jgi:serine/threonine-protein kinase HipA
MDDLAVDVVVQVGPEDVLAGRLWSHRRRGGESATFAYDPAYLGRSDAYDLEPALPRSRGAQQTADGRKIFGAFSDCAPDRWGRRLIARAERRRVKSAGGAERSFGEMDYLLGVRDDLRQGALRFRDITSGTYLADEKTGVPPLVRLPKLLNAADRLERDEASEDDLQALLRGGSSLGGARPKAHALHPDGRAAIAKFPSATDNWDVIRWEAVALTLARDAGIWVPGTTVELADGKAVLIVDRFDRDGPQRTGYVSAMTMLEASDGEHRSYVDIAEVIEVHSSETTRDLRQLWRRVVFSILISNTDDHLRNHGFLRASSAGWSLSPAFDINPDPSPGPKYLSTAIDGVGDDPARLDPLMDLASLFRLKEEDARRVVGEVSEATARWPTVAKRVGLSAGEIEEMAPAFEHHERARAKTLAAGERLAT